MKVNAESNNLLVELLTAPVHKDLYCSRRNVNERQFRRMIAELAEVFPVVALSNGTGYKICSDVEEVDLIKAEIAETVSRINKLKARLEPLVNVYSRILKEGEKNEK